MNSVLVKVPVSGAKPPEGIGKPLERSGKPVDAAWPKLVEFPTGKGAIVMVVVTVVVEVALEVPALPPETVVSKDPVGVWYEPESSPFTVT